ncbi:MAG TPA: NINE protein [Gemmatimonadaceae bacterium]|nr:NINE protein [Gemmatimonadaceae bacterium]
MSESSSFGTVTTCRSCGGRILAASEVCPRCGVRQFGTPSVPEAVALEPLASDKRVLPTFLFCLLLGVFGAHRFYVGRKGTAVLQLLTLGGLGIWMLIDMVMILAEAFKDGRGRPITEWV